MRALAFAALLFASIAASAQSIDPAAVDRLATETLTKSQIPGFSIAIVSGDRVVYAKGFGVKEAGGREAVDADTLFQIGSTSKAFTTTAMAILVGDGKLSWDDPVRKHIPYFRLSDPCADSLVTLRDIVSHRTGLSRHDELWDDSPFTREDLVRRIGHVKLSRPFRTAYQYQNIMFIAAGEAVEAASGTSWDDFVTTRIFRPLGMTSTRPTMAGWETTNHATGHRWARKEGRSIVQKPIDDASVAPAGSIVSNARDMAQWLRFHLAGGTIDGRRVVAADALEETKTPQTLLRSEGITRDENPESHLNAYGLGWRIQDYRGELLVSHGGALNGFRAQVGLLPKRNAGVVVLANAGRGYAVVAMRNAILDMLFASPRKRDWYAYYADLDRRSIEDDEKKKSEREAKRRTGTKPSRELAAYAGTYENEGYGPVTISYEGNGLTLRWNRLSAPMTHWHYDVFRAGDSSDDIDEEVIFTLGSDGEVRTLSLFGEDFRRK